MADFVLKNGVNLTIRAARPNDAQAVLDSIEIVSGESDFQTFGPGEFGLSVEQEASVLARFDESANQIYVLALIDGQIVGTGVLGASQRPRLRHRCELSMSTQKRFWGLGIGRKVLEYLIAWAKQNEQLTKLDLEVRTDNERAIRLYERCGFENEATLKKQIFHKGVYHDLFRMGMDV